MISFYGSLTELDKLSACLLRIHRDTLVNIDKIQCYLKKEAKIILIDGTALPVSRTGEKILAKQLTDNKYAFWVFRLIKKNITDPFTSVLLCVTISL